MNNAVDHLFLEANTLENKIESVHNYVQLYKKILHINYRIAGYLCGQKQ